MVEMMRSVQVSKLDAHFLRHLYIKTIILPRQARDKHRENSKKEWRKHNTEEKRLKYSPKQAPDSNSQYVIIGNLSVLAGFFAGHGGAYGRAVRAAELRGR